MEYCYMMSIEMSVKRYLKTISTAQTALWTKTTKELNEMKNIVQTSLKDYNAKVTPQTIIKGSWRMLWIGYYEIGSKWKEYEILELWS